MRIGLAITKRLQQQLKIPRTFKQFNYTASLEAIATVLEEIEPGSYKRIEDTYYREIGKN